MKGKRVRPVHREYLTKLRDAGKLVISGPLTDSGGALIVLEKPAGLLTVGTADDKTDTLFFRLALNSENQKGYIANFFKDPTTGRPVMQEIIEALTVALDAAHAGL